MPNFHFGGKPISFLVKIVVVIGAIIAGSCLLSAQTSITITTSQTELNFSRLSGYDVVGFADAYYSTAPGEPSLPAKIIKVALPEGLKVTGVNLLRSDSEIITGEYAILPTQKPRLVGSDDNIPFIEPDPVIYESSTAFPSGLVEFIRQTDLAGQSMAIVRINPIQYLPSQKKLQLFTSISFTIEGTTGYICGDYLPVKVSEDRQEYYTESLQNMVVNPEAVRVQNSPETPVQSGVAAGNYDYVIITSSSYASYFQSLADWKTRKGVPATIVTTAWIYNQGGYSGTDEDKIQEFVQDAYSTWGATYFLLGGDTNIIPAHSRYVNGEDVPNDTYYADFDNDWLCEVQVGRAPAKSAAEINNFKAKVITYEMDPPLTGYATKAALFGFDLDNFTDGEDCKIFIDNYYIPSSWTMTNVYDSDSGDHRTNCRNAINSGQNLINHIDHCNEYYLGTGSFNHDLGFGTSDVDGFYNGDRQCIFYTIGCHANAYDTYECISEHMMLDTNGGCAAYVGNSRNGIYYQGDTDYYSFRFDKYFFRSIFSQNHYKVGDAFSDHKNDVSLSDDTWEYLFTGLTLLGDPEMPIWTDDPQALVVDHPAGYELGGSDFPVHVENESGSSIYQACVCLMKTGEVYDVGYTNSSGDVTFSPDPSTTGTMFVTVTAHNYLPSETEATIEDPRGAVAGFITDNNMSELANVHIYCGSPALDTYSNINGDYILYGFDTGSYNISFSCPGFIDTTVYGVSVVRGDTVTLNMVMRPYPYDASATLIFSPPDTMLVDMESPVSCEVHNYGTETASFNVIFAAKLKYSSAVVFADTMAISNMPGGTVDTVTFPDEFTPSIDTLYDLTAYTALPTDMEHSNDTTLSDCQVIQGVMVWYGKLDSSPVPAYIASELGIDVYVLTSPDVYVADMHLCLGVVNDYIIAFNSQSTGSFYFPLTEWANTEFLDPQGNPPNEVGWSSQSFIGFARLSRAGSYITLDETPWLHVAVPTKIMTFTVETSDDSLLANTIVSCIGTGYNLYQGGSNAGDSLGYDGFKVVETFSPIMFRSPSGVCDYVPGDVNGSGNVIGSDVTYLVNYFRGAAAPPDSCWNDLASSWLYSAADVNGDCNVIGSDVTYLVNFFRAIQTEIHWCPETPPAAVLFRQSPETIDENNQSSGTK